MACLFCEENEPANPANFKKYKHQLKHDKRIGHKIDAYIDKHSPDILKGVIKIPEVRFYTQGRSPDCPEPDLIADEHMNASYGTIRNRQSAEDEESIARKFHNWACNYGNMPALVMCSFAFQHYLKNYLDTDEYSFILTNKLLGETDIICLAKSRGLFICEVKSNLDGSSHLAENIKKSYFQAQKATTLFRLLNAHCKSVDKIIVHRLVAFTNIPEETLKSHLCQKHLHCCIDKHALSTQETFEAFIEDYLSNKGLEAGYSPYSISNEDFKSICGRYISISTTFEAPLSKNEVSKKVTNKIDKIGASYNYFTPQQKIVIDKFSIKNGEMKNIIISGHFGTGKTLLMQLGVRKLYEMLRKHDEKHLIVFTSLLPVEMVNDKGILFWKKRISNKNRPVYVRCKIPPFGLDRKRYECKDSSWSLTA